LVPFPIPGRAGRAKAKVKILVGWVFQANPGLGTHGAFGFPRITTSGRRIDTKLKHGLPGTVHWKPIEVFTAAVLARGIRTASVTLPKRGSFVLSFSSALKHGLIFLRSLTIKTRPSFPQGWPVIIRAPLVI